MRVVFNPADWFWAVGADPSRAWSSAAKAYVSEWPEDRVTRIASEAELRDVLRQWNLPNLAPYTPATLTPDDYGAAIQAHIESAAKGRGYNDAVTCASYTASTVATWAADAAAFVAWRDNVWAYAYGELAAVQAGQKPAPTITELIAGLPAITWPV